MPQGIVHDNSTSERGYKLPHPDNVPHSDIQRLVEALDAIDSDVASLLLALTQKVGPDALVALKNEKLGGAGPAIDTLRELADKDAADVAGLTALIGGKANASHSHAIANVSGLQSALNGKAASSHGHSINSIAGLQAALDAAGNGITQADLDNLKTVILGGAGPAIDTLKELADKDAADVAGLTALIGQKANASHSHDGRYYTEGEVDTKLAQKANSSHSHAIANVSGLQGALNGKAASSHNHSLSTLPITVSTANPSGGSDGDIWFKREA